MVTATRTPSPPAGRSCWTQSYGMRHCEGYRVVGPKGRVGYVEDVRLDPFDDVRAIVVGGARRLFVPRTEIESIDVDSELVRLTHQPR
jgi:hypothetical protein